MIVVLARNRHPEMRVQGHPSRIRRRRSNRRWPNEFHDIVFVLAGLKDLNKIATIEFAVEIGVAKPGFFEDLHPTVRSSSLTKLSPVSVKADIVCPNGYF